MLVPLVAGALLAGPTVQVDLPALFAEQLPRVAARTEVPVLLPDRMPSDFAQHVPSGFGARRDWGLQIASRPGCGGAGACFVASFGGRAAALARSGAAPCGWRTGSPGASRR
jgi:hypothetical protein